MDINTPGKLARKLGAIPAKDMSMESMTVKLAWLLGKNVPYKEIKRRMRKSLRGEISSEISINSVYIDSLPYSTELNKTNGLLYED